MTYCLAQGDKSVSLPVYWAKLAQWRNRQTLELVQRWGRTAQLAALAGFLKTGQESLSKKGTSCTDIWRGIWLPQHRHLMPIRWWREPACPPAAVPAAQVLSHLQKPQRHLREPNSEFQFWQGNILHLFVFHSKMSSQRSPRWVVYKLGSRWEAVQASRPAAEVETDSSPDTSPTWLHHTTLPSSLANCEAAYSHSRQTPSVSPHQSAAVR